MTSCSSGMDTGIPVNEDKEVRVDINKKEKRKEKKRKEKKRKRKRKRNKKEKKRKRKEGNLWGSCHNNCGHSIVKELTDSWVRQGGRLLVFFLEMG